MYKVKFWKLKVHRFAASAFRLLAVWKELYIGVRQPVNENIRFFSNFFRFGSAANGNRLIQYLPGFMHQLPIQIMPHFADFPAANRAQNRATGFI